MKMKMEAGITCQFERHLLSEKSCDSARRGSLKCASEQDRDEPCLRANSVGAERTGWQQPPLQRSRSPCSNRQLGFRSCCLSADPLSPPPPSPAHRLYSGSPALPILSSHSPLLLHSLGFLASLSGDGPSPALDLLLATLNMVGQQSRLEFSELESKTASPDLLPLSLVFGIRNLMDSASLLQLSVIEALNAAVSGMTGA